MGCFPDSLARINKQRLYERESCNMPLELEVEAVRDTIEKVMLQLPSEQNQDDHRKYLAGYIDCLHDNGQISDDAHEIVYAEYSS